MVHATASLEWIWDWIWFGFWNWGFGDLVGDVVVVVVVEKCLVSFIVATMQVFTI